MKNRISVENDAEIASKIGPFSAKIFYLEIREKYLPVLFSKKRSIFQHKFFIKSFDNFTPFTDLYVSLHRSEGSGLTMMEMLNLEKPVVCTGYSGNLDFCKDEGVFLVDYKKIPIQTESLYIGLLEGIKCEWADPVLDDAVDKIRFAFSNYNEALKKAKWSADFLKREFSVSVFGKSLEGYVQKLYSD